MDAPIRGEILAFEGFRFDPRARQVLRRDPAGAWVPVPIHSRALEILAVLLNNPGVVVCKDAIMTAVWPGRQLPSAGDGRLPRSWLHI